MGSKHSIDPELFTDDGKMVCSRCKIPRDMSYFRTRNDAKYGYNRMCDLCCDDSRLTSKCGVGMDWYQKTLAAQGGGCGICGTTDPGSPGRSKYFSVDHDHSCPHPKGRSCAKCVRGLLCIVCNTKLALVEKFGYKYAPFEKYLRKHEKGGCGPEQEVLFSLERPEGDFPRPRPCPAGLAPQIRCNLCARPHTDPDLKGAGWAYYVPLDFGRSNLPSLMFCGLCVKAIRENGKTTYAKIAWHSSVPVRQGAAFHVNE